MSPPVSEQKPEQDAQFSAANLLPGIGIQRLLGTALLTSLLIALIYSTGRRDQPAEVLPPPPVLEIAAVPAPPTRGDELIWGRFSADCWVRLKRGEQILIDRLYVAGETLAWTPRAGRAPPDALWLGNREAAEIYWRGDRLDLRDAIGRGAVVQLALSTARSQSAPLPLASDRTSR